MPKVQAVVGQDFENVVFSTRKPTTEKKHQINPEKRLDAEPKKVFHEKKSPQYRSKHYRSSG